MPFPRTLVGLVLVLPAPQSGLVACGTKAPAGFVAPDVSSDAGGGDDVVTASDAAAPTDDSGSGLSFGDAQSHAPAVTGDGSVVLPSNFVPTELGGYALGPAITTGGSDAGMPVNSGSANCSLITGVVRDFKDQSDDNNTGHPDFGTYSGVTPTTGLVTAALGADLKPVYAGNCGAGTSILAAGCPWGQMLTSKADFDQWYRFASGVNLPFLVYLQFVPNMGVYTFDSESYFPLDGAGWGDNASDGTKLRNFGFTTELHLQFIYKGGETFTFKGDDDVWAFIDHKLAVDLGGTHSAASGSVMLDSLGLTKGMTYPLDLFNAERHPTGSHFRVDTNLSFTSCGTIPPDVPQ